MPFEEDDPLEGTLGKHLESAPPDGQATQDSQATQRKGSQDNQASPKKGSQDSQASPKKGSRDSQASPKKGSRDSQASPKKGSRDSQASPKKGSRDSQASPKKGSRDSQASPKKGSRDSQASPKRGSQDSQASPKKGSQDVQATQRKGSQESQASQSKGSQDSQTSQSKGSMEKTDETPSEQSEEGEGPEETTRSLAHSTSQIMESQLLYSSEENELTSLESPKSESPHSSLEILSEQSAETEESERLSKTFEESSEQGPQATPESTLEILVGAEGLSAVKKPSIRVYEDDVLPEEGEEEEEEEEEQLEEEEPSSSGEAAPPPQESLLYHSEEDGLFKKKTEKEKIYPLSLAWCYGWNSALPVYNLRNQKPRLLLYAAAHTAVLYDALRNCQRHLQGHSNVITCMSVSENRRWISTADKGPQCLVIIWDSFSGIPVRTIFNICPEGNGIKAMAMTNDAKFLVTIDDATCQKVCIWRWTVDTETPACFVTLKSKVGVQEYIIFNPANYRELVSNSKTQLLYYEWDEVKGTLEFSTPVLTEKTFNKTVGKFSQSLFHFVTRQILTATMEGKLVVWDLHPPPRSYTSLEVLHIKACKLLHLQKDGLTVLTTVDNFFVTGDVRGHIKFYDSKLSLVYWYSQFKLGPIRMLSFSKDPLISVGNKSNFSSDCTLPGDPFIVRNFVIATSNARVFHLKTEETQLEEILIEPKEAIHAIACHPYKPLIAIGSVCGLLKMWNYRKKMYVVSRIFKDGLGIQSLTFNPEGFLLGVGFTSGSVYILDAVSLKNEAMEPFKYSRGNITHISFSHDSQYLATADVNCTVAVYKTVIKNEVKVWEYLARLHSHHKEIQSLLFGIQPDNTEPRLLSLGKDRLLIEYDLLRSTRDQLEILDIHRTDQEAIPNCMIWYPPLTRESFLLICNSMYKVKLFNSTTKMCRRTLIGPTYGSPIEQILVLPEKASQDVHKRYLAFINRDKVGLQILPIDGNPHKTAAIICHPNGVSNMTLSYDGTYAFTAGGDDRTVLQWEITLQALEAAVYLGGEDLNPFYGLLDGGREGEFYKELEDYFYYSQLRSQGIDTMETRKVSTHIPLSELPFLMRAIGFYPSEEQIDDMLNEVKFSEYVDTGKLVDSINLPEFVKVYINHRPPFGQTMSEIRNAFKVLGYLNKDGKMAIKREDFLELLLTKGEHMTEEELSDCFSTLFGLNPEGWKSEPATLSHKGSDICLEEELPEEITAEIFTTDILGLPIPEDF
ncbi:cilia- and flagella-associated protein 251 isoform X1 [Macrotis lagotis]|uniref:cilia- and flagella-associated protein 251 isoform X1 n=1 Tax=Macrotis lagotis TaxID=92651 RepID=UPI003D6984DB